MSPQLQLLLLRENKYKRFATMEDYQRWKLETGK